MIYYSHSVENGTRLCGELPATSKSEYDSVVSFPQRRNQNTTQWRASTASKMEYDSVVSFPQSQN